MFKSRGAANVALAIVLLAALALRLHNISFGLPSLYDPDEPIFMVVALKLLKQHTLNPGWFGHPGSTTIYLIALIDVAVFGVGVLTGRFANVHDFAAAAYADPSLLFVPARVAMALFGVVCVWLTFLLGRRTFGAGAGLIGAGLVAINSLHILWSQVIRTDVMASACMLGSLFFAVRVAEQGRTKDYLLAGALIGLGAATKWPSVIVSIGLVGASFRYSQISKSGPFEIRKLSAAVICALGTLFLASPYIFLDWHTVLANVNGEMSHGHLAQTGKGFFPNLGWYLFTQAATSMGWVGLSLAILGAVVAGIRNDVSRWTLLPVAAAFLALISGQGTIWSRWLVPEIPFLCLFAAALITEAARHLSQRYPRLNGGVLATAGALAVALPSAASARDRVAERALDTRALAAAWAVSHFPTGSTVLIEHLELRLRSRAWHFLFPIGEAGCVDAVKMLTGGMSYDQLQRLRHGSPIVDLGNVNHNKLNTCKADFAIITYYDQYLREARNYPAELRNYQELFAGGRSIALFKPEEGKVGGPVVRIVALAQQSKTNSKFATGATLK